LASFRKYLGPLFIASGILATIANLLQFSGPIMINNVLEFLADPNHPPLSEGIIYVSILIICYILRTIIFQHSMHYVNLNCIQIQNSANSLIYHKILKLSSASRKYLETGSIMNYINVDTMSFYFFIMMSTFLFSAPFMILTAIVLLIIEVGWIGIAAPILFAGGMFVQQKVMKKGFQLRKDSLFWTDKRSKAVNEYFSGIRIIKYYGWEKLVSEKIENIRKN
jgi:ABC-type multidrug transport system fused ATPase/permease subunit